MPAGRPTSYDPKYCDEIIEYFSVEPYKDVTKNVIDKGKVLTVTVTEANDTPSFAGFAAQIGICKETLRNWRAEHPEFMAAYKKAKALQENFYVINGTKGLLNTAFAIFAAKNVLDWRDKKPDEVNKTIVHNNEITVQHADLEDRIKQLEEDK